MYKIETEKEIKQASEERIFYNISMHVKFNTMMNFIFHAGLNRINITMMERHYIL